MHIKNIISAGKPLQQGTKVLIMLHGRGGSADDILSMADYLNVKDYTLLAPQATNNSWYPYSFLAPQKQNEPWLSSALSMIKDLHNEVTSIGIAHEDIYFMGFSQGACLTLEYVARNAATYGGIAAFTGGLIGDKIDPANYKGDFNKTPVFIGTGSSDPHVPVERVYATSNMLKNMNAVVTEKVYTNRAHTISEDEIIQANMLIFSA
ncbi:phospholipase [Segetibacter sp. 3557_3]|uniref:alpha/beta hydrolase n=1 Tax=Segetibacter sp. 3557_3 TaxID=2547429 RepID=UPI001058A4F8|nr:dienelactone hydrolase family protein [Segetibacter sp. 3557_3]TDH21559.1 phospholipase [Segetibacter sp. 3557_3]